MKKLFYSSAYNVKHSEITKENVEERLKDDIRAKMLGDVKKFVYGERSTLEINPQFLYVGGFYYEKETAGLSQCENTVESELNEINEADIIMVSLLKYSSIATVTELIYAAQLHPQKKIIVFYDPEITQFEVEFEYWFPILTAMRLNRNIVIVCVQNEEEILQYIRNYNDYEKIVLATNNPGKLREFRQILYHSTILGLKDAGINHEFVENETTIFGNARKKAQEISRLIDLPVIADDSGLCIDALYGFPGVLTHRFLGENVTDAERNNFLVRLVPSEKARFICDLVYQKGGEQIHGHGELVGKIASEPRGSNGFGFDPIFELPDGRTLAELSPEEKNQLSARHLAVVDLLEKLRY